MKAAIICPVPLLQRYGNATSYHLTLAHLYNESGYALHYGKRKSVGDFVIMDNSVVEVGRPVSLSTLSGIVANTFRPSEMVLPDVPGDPVQTYANAKDGERFREVYPEVRLMVVPQGMTVLAWMQSYERLCGLKHVDTIGIGKFLGGMRDAIIQELNRARDPNKEYHLLGTYDNGMEVVTYNELEYDWIRGVDSKLPVRAGLHGVTLHPDLGMLVRRDALHALDMMTRLDPFPIITKHNIDVFTKWADENGRIIPFDRKS